MDYTQFMNHIKQNFDLQLYGLNEGFEQFQKRALECLDVIDREPFEWRDNDGNDITLYVTIKTEAIEFEDDEPVRFERFYGVDQ